MVQGERVSVSGPQWALAIIIAALLGTGGVLAATKVEHQSPAEQVTRSHVDGSLQRIESKIDTQGREVSILRAEVAEIRGELKARKSAP